LQGKIRGAAIGENKFKQQKRRSVGYRYRIKLLFIGDIDDKNN
jgi:hypothetical protein